MIKSFPLCPEEGGIFTKGHAMIGFEIEQKHVITGEQASKNGRLKLWSLFTMFQDIAGDHSTLLGFSADKMAADGYFWAVTNYRNEISRLPEEGEEVLLRTCVGRPAHAIFPRYFRLFGKDGELLASCASRWALVDIKKRTAAVGAPGFEVFNGQKNPWELREAGSVKPEETSRSISFDLPSEYIDRNGHMNNARYFEMAEDMLGSEINGLAPCFAAMEYRTELLPGTPMKVSIGSADLEKLGAGAHKAFYLFGETEEAQIFRMKLGYR